MLSKIRLASSIVIASLAVLLSTPAFADPGSPPAAPINRKVVDPARQLTAPTRGRMTTASGSSDEAQRYATRESHAKPLETFRGGERGIYIGTGALVVALLIVLIIVLI
jgi:hypothetical protein